MRIRARLLAVDTGLQRELIQETSLWMLGLRLAEGLAVCIAFSALYRPTPAQAWNVYLAIALYAVANIALALRYRIGDVRLAWVAIDLVANLVPMTIVIQASGGLASPLVLMYPMKVAGYLIIFSPEVGILSIGGSLLGLFVLGATGYPALWQGAPIHPRELRHLNVGTRLAFVLLLLLVGAPVIRRVRWQRYLLQRETDRARTALERERNSAAIAGTLLMVTDAVSRLTQVNEVLDTVVDIVPQVLNVDYCGVLVWDERRGVYRFKAVSGAEADVLDRLYAVRLTPEEAPDLEWVRRLGRCAVVPPGPQAPLGLDDVPILLLAPLLSGGRFFGVLLFGRRAGGVTFTQRDISVADGVAAQVAVALERADLVEEAQRLVQALDSTGESVVITDASADIIYANPAFLRTFGYVREQLIGQNAVTIVRNLPPQWIADVSNAARQGGWRGEVDIDRPDGTTLPILLDVSLIRDGEGRARGAVAIFEDISDRKHMQERMLRADRLAAAGGMAAGIAHEVNNALVGILHEAGRAETETDTEVLREALRRVEIQGNRIATIVQGLLGFAQPRAPERCETSVRDLVDETLGLQRYELAKAHIEVDVDVPLDLPPLWADPKQMQQVLVNLITNAQHAMSPQGGRLTIRAARDGDEVVLTVADTGKGIAAEQLTRIFDPFFTTKTKGTGLGLSVSYQIVRAHQGDLSARSIPGSGAEFTVRLPAAVQTRNERALVVDDDLVVGQTLVEMLEREGLEVEHVVCGRDALARLEGERPYDVVFLDVRLPDLSGPEVYERLAASRPSQARRVIFVTGGFWRSGDGHGLRESLPPQPALAKPWTAQQVRQVLQAVRRHTAAA